MDLKNSKIIHRGLTDVHHSKNLLKKIYWNVFLKAFILPFYLSLFFYKIMKE